MIESVERDINATIKGRIAECIADELFKELGFFVMKYGQEHQVEPITQLQNFIKRCGGNFKLKYSDPKFENSFDFVRRMPDFLIVKNNFEPELLEVKYRRTGIFEDNTGVKDKQINAFFDNYPCAVLLLVVDKSKINPDKFKELYEDLEVAEEMINTNLQIIFSEDDENNNEEVNYIPQPLVYWLRETYNIPIAESKPIIAKYDKLIGDWLNSK
ncbi:MAG: hypothetical protein PHN22_04405 [Candidatus ainarchaeum sp.]|nr:hypothetical protein [Candidatus ainarchaeum sp.]